MDPPYLQDFLNSDFSHQCFKDRYCFTCHLAFCSHCCPDHGAHHPNPKIAQVRLIGGHTMIDAVDSKGVGYDWRRIQWIRSHGDRWMHLQRPHVQLPYLNYPHQCIACHDKRKSHFDFCSVTCQVNHVHGANGIAQATNLLAANWEPMDCDRYCTRCRKAFTSAFCGLHVEEHHKNQIAASIEVFHQQGWFLVPPNQQVLPHAMFEGVQVVQVDGVAMHPIRSRPLHLQVPPVANWMHPCAGPCNEGVPVGARFCSLLCHRHVQG